MGPLHYESGGEPQVWDPDQKKFVTGEIKVHIPCGHWHTPVPEEVAPELQYNLIAPLITEVYDIGYKPGSEYFYIANSLYIDGVYNIGLFKIKVSHLHTYEYKEIPCFAYYACVADAHNPLQNICIVDDTETYGYFSTHASYQANPTLWKIDLSDMSLVGTISTQPYGHLKRGLIYNNYLYAATYYQGTDWLHYIVKIDLATFSIVGSLPLTSYALASCSDALLIGDIGYFAMGPWIYAIDLDAFSVLAVSPVFTAEMNSFVQLGSHLLCSVDSAFGRMAKTELSLVTVTHNPYDPGNNKQIILDQSSLLGIGWYVGASTAFDNLCATNIELLTAIIGGCPNPSVFGYDATQLSSNAYLNTTHTGLWGGRVNYTGDQRAFLRWMSFDNYLTFGQGIAWIAIMVGDDPT
jgi:hypothetical protein